MDHPKCLFHFFWGIHSDYLILPAGFAFDIVDRGLQYLTQSPVYPFSVSVFYKKDAYRIGYEITQPRFTPKTKHFSGDILNFIGTFEMFFQHEFFRESLFSGDLKSIVYLESAC